MGKILPKKKFFKSSIYSPKLNVGSHIDNVKYSLEHLIFSNTREVENNLLKKRIKVVAITTVLLMIIGSFLSPKGQAEVAVFYPTSCLGGWNNPRNAEGEPQVGTSGDASEFNMGNSAMLAKETNADLYCGSFVGEIEQNTKPIKMVVSLSWSAKDILVHAKQLDIVSTSTESIETGTSTASATLMLASSTESSEASSSVVLPVEVASTTDASSTEETTTVLEKVVDLVGGILGKIFGGNDTASTTEATTTIPVQNNEPISSTTTTEALPVASSTESLAPVAPVQEQTPVQESVPTESVPTESAPVESTPTSFLETIVQKIAGRLIGRVFAQEIGEQTVSATTSEENSKISISATSTEASSTEQIIASSTEVTASSTDITTGTTTAVENTTNDFLEVLYTFDGITWNTLGKVNESSIQYRTFEIPVTASTSWEDMGQLQIKVQPLQRIDAKPIVYVDGIKVEVLYETPLTHEHPDFVRDTILQDDVIKGVRILRIINNDTNKEEIWYMHPEEATSTVVATTTVDDASSTIALDASTTKVVEENIAEVSSSTNATSTEPATTTLQEADRVVKPFSIKNKWLKLESEETSAKGLETLLREISEQEEKQEYMFPDFSKDFIKHIKGSFVTAVVVQVEQAGVDTLWLFDTEHDTQEKIDKDGKTTFSKTFPFGMKGDNVFWLSEDGLIVFAYNVVTKKIEQKEIPPHDESLGERGEVTFEAVPWKVIIGADQFSFYSESTGEVFSDDNLATSEAFRMKEKLDTLLSQDKIEELNFIVTENKSE